MSEDYAAGAGVADHPLEDVVEAVALPPSHLHTRTDLDIEVKRYSGKPSMTIQHARMVMDYPVIVDGAGLFIGSIWLSWEELAELRRLLT